MIDTISQGLVSMYFPFMPFSSYANLLKVIFILCETQDVIL